MKIFSLVSLALAANSMLANGYTLKQQPISSGQLGPQQVINPASRPDFLAPPEAPVPEPPAVGSVGSADGSLSAPVPVQGEPYAFAYDQSADQFSSSRSELSDGKKVTGHYTLQGADGFQRIVHYVADSDGFRASIQTNEPGTESQSPSGVLIQSSQLPGAEIARQFGSVVQPFAQPVLQSGAQPVVQPAIQPLSQPIVAPVSVPVSNLQQFGAASPAFVAFQGQDQQQQSQEEENESEPQQQQQQEEEIVPAAVKTRPLLPPSPAPVPSKPPPPPTTTTTQSPPIKGRPIKTIIQQPVKNILQPIKIPQPIKTVSAPVPAPALLPIPAPIKSKPTPPPSVKGRPIITQPAPVKSKPVPPPPPTPSAPTKSRPNVKIPQAPIKIAPIKRPQQQQVIAPKPLPALLPVPAPQPIKTPQQPTPQQPIPQQPTPQQPIPQQPTPQQPIPQQPTPQQPTPQQPIPQQEEEEGEDEQTQQQQSEIALEGPQDEPTFDQDF